MIDLHDHFIQQFQTQGSKKGIKITKQHQPTKRKRDFCLKRATKEKMHLITMIDLHDHFIQQFQTQGSKKGIKITKQHQPTKRKRDFGLKRATKEKTHLSVSTSSTTEQEDFVQRNRKRSLIVLFRFWNPRAHMAFSYFQIGPKYQPNPKSPKS